MNSLEAWDQNPFVHVSGYCIDPIKGAERFPLPDMWNALQSGERKLHWSVQTPPGASCRTHPVGAERTLGAADDRDAFGIDVGHSK